MEMGGVRESSSPRPCATGEKKNLDGVTTGGTRHGKGRDPRVRFQVKKKKSFTK